MRAGLYTGVTLPAHVGFNVVSTSKGFIDVHDVGRADVNAFSTTITTRHIYKGWHNIFLYFL
jgi:hypothetical protein